MAIYYTAGDTGSNWNGGTIFNGSSSQNGYGFYIGVRETYVGSSSENISNIAIQIGIKNNGVRFSTNGWCFKYTVDGVVCDYATGVNIGTNYAGYYDDVRPITLDGSNNRGMYVNSIPHNDNGTKTVHIKVEMYNSTYGAYTPGYCVVEGDLTLTTIPRGTTITSFSVSTVDETSVRLNWTASDPCDYAWWTTDDAYDDWKPLPGDNIIRGLPVAYQRFFKIRLRRTDTQVTVDSGIEYGHTYDYPKPTSVNDFIIGNKCKVDLYNPLGRNVTLDLISNNDGSIIGSYTGTYNGILSGFDDPTSVNNQYASIPDRMGSTYYARVTCSAVGSTKTYGNGTYSITGDVKPVITIDAEDTNKTLATGNRTCNLTGSNKTFIKFMSNANVTLEAIAQKGSKIKSTYIKYSGDTRPTSIIDTTRIQTETFTNVENVTFTGNATDTREQSLQTPVSATGLTLVPYIKLTLENVTLYRQNQTDDTLYCSGDGDYFNDTFGSVANTITFKYRYKESSVSSWEGISWNTQSVTVGSGNEYSFDFQVGTTFDYTKTYNFQFEVSDACMVVTDSHDAKPGVPVQGLFENFHEAFGVKTFERDNNGNVSLDENITIPNNFEYKTLTTGSNIDNLSEQGVFGVYNATGTLPTGYSTSDNNTFIQNMLWGDGTYGRQIFYDIRTNSTYSREKSQGSWTSWERFNSIEYSNNDIVIGKWINNKPVYRRVIHTTNLIVQPSGYSVAVGLTNPSEIIRIDLSLKDSRNDWYTFWHLTDIIYRHSRNAVDVYGDSSATFDEAYIIIEYTKTTD